MPQPDQDVSTAQWRHAGRESSKEFHDTITRCRDAMQENWRAEVNLRSIALVRAGHWSRRHLIGISWLSLYNLTNSLPCSSSDHSCRWCDWLCWFIPPASSCYDTLLNTTCDSIYCLVHYALYTSTSQCCCTYESARLCSVCSRGGWLCFLHAASSRVKPFLHRCKCIILSYFPLSCITNTGQRFLPSFLLSFLPSCNQSNYRTTASFHWPRWQYEQFVCAVCTPPDQRQNKARAHRLHFPFQLSGEHNGCGLWPCYILYRHSHH